MVCSRSWGVSPKTSVLSLWLTMRWRLFAASFFRPSLIWEVQHNTHRFIPLTRKSLSAFGVSCWHWILNHAAELDLQGNVLTKLPDAVAEMEHLTSISLAKNSFSVFPDKLTEIATLERMNLEGNQIIGNICLWEQKHFFYMAKLKLCFFFSFFFPTEIPVDKLSDMPALKWLNVQANPLDPNTLSALQSPHSFEVLTTQS